MTTAEKLIKVAENVEKVYEAGYANGKAEGGSVEIVERNCNWTLFENNKDEFTTPYYIEINSSYGWILGHTAGSGKNFIIHCAGETLSFVAEYIGETSKLFVNGVEYGNTDLPHTFDKIYMETDIEIYFNNINWDTFRYSNLKIYSTKDVVDVDDLITKSNYDYRYLFAGSFWTDDNFKPTRNLTCGYAEKMFAYSKITNLKRILDGYGVSLNVSPASKNGSVTQMFQGSRITDVGVLDVSGGGLTYMLNGAKYLKNVERIVLKSDGSQAFTSCFDNCTALENISFSGKIGQSINLKWSTKLSDRSLMDIVISLSDTSTGKTCTLPTTARSNYDAVNGDGAWDSLITFKTNWSFAYA